MWWKTVIIINSTKNYFCISNSHVRVTSIIIIGILIIYVYIFAFFIRAFALELQIIIFPPLLANSFNSTRTHTFDVLFQWHCFTIFKWTKFDQMELQSVFGGFSPKVENSIDEKQQTTLVHQMD